MERPKSWMTSGAFARLCGTTKETLRHYKDTGLLPPAHQGENGYFYYDLEQFYDFLAIVIFRQTGTPLEEIRRCMESQTPQGTLALLREQRRRLEEERQRLEQMEFVLSRTIGDLELGTAPDLTPQRAWFPAERLLAIPAGELEGLISPGAGEDEMLITVLERCQRLCREYGLQPDHRLGAIHSPGEGAITHLFTRVREGKDCPYCREKPAGEYLYLCCRGRWDISAGYGALARYIREEGAETAGDLYAWDRAGFILSGTEKNAASMLAVRLVGEF